METETKKAETTQMDSEFTGPFPRYSGAITSVTEGSPEDMNEMPASLNKKNSYAISPSEQTANFIPDEAIEISDEERTGSSIKRNNYPPVDGYSSEKVSPDVPTDADVKSGPVEDTIVPG